MRPALLLAEVERLEVAPDGLAKVVLDERTGTVVMGENVCENRLVMVPEIAIFQAIKAAGGLQAELEII